jgi:hypothetical protein
MPCETNILEGRIDTVRAGIFRYQVIGNVAPHKSIDPRMRAWLSIAVLQVIKHPLRMP